MYSHCVTFLAIEMYRWLTSIGPTYHTCQYMYHSLWCPVKVMSWKLDCMLRKAYFELTTKKSPEVCITGPLWGESTGDRWFLHTKGPVMQKAFPFLNSMINCPFVTTWWPHMSLIMIEPCGAINDSEPGIHSHGQQLGKPCSKQSLATRDRLRWLPWAQRPMLQINGSAKHCCNSS